MSRGMRPLQPFCQTHTRTKLCLSWRYYSVSTRWNALLFVWADALCLPMFTGPIPPELGLLRKLKGLHLMYNNLSGKGCNNDGMSTMAIVLSLVLKVAGAFCGPVCHRTLQMA